MLKAKAFYLGAILAVFALLAGACTTVPEPSPNPTPAPPPGPSPSPAPSPVIEVLDAPAALDAALDYLREKYGDNAPGAGLVWQEKDRRVVGLRIQILYH